MRQGVFWQAAVPGTRPSPARPPPLLLPSSKETSPSPPILAAALSQPAPERRPRGAAPRGSGEVWDTMTQPWAIWIIVVMSQGKAAKTTTRRFTGTIWPSDAILEAKCKILVYIDLRTQQLFVWIIWQNKWTHTCLWSWSSPVMLIWSTWISWKVNISVLEVMVTTCLRILCRDVQASRQSSMALKMAPQSRRQVPPNMSHQVHACLARSLCFQWLWQISKLADLHGILDEMAISHARVAI